MRKTEILRQSAAASNEKHLAQLAQEIETLRQARHQSVEALAAALEPLAQAMAALSEETRQTLDEIDRKSRAQAETFAHQQQQLMRAWRQTAKTLQAAAERLDQASQTARRAARGWTWKLWIGVLIAALMPILALLIASWLWLHPQILTQRGVTWLLIRLG